MPGPRAPTGATAFVLELDGAAAGQARSAAGGDAVAEVVVEPAGPDGIRRKHLGAVRYTDIVLACGIDMEKSFWSWLADTVAGKSSPRDGALRMLDFERKERELATFTNAMVTEIGLPALDAASRDAFQLTVRITAERVQRKRGSGASVSGNVKAGKQALVSNFRVSLDGLDLDNVARVGPLTLRRPLAEEAEIPDLDLTLSEARSESIVDWHRKFVIDGNNSVADEKSGSIALLDPARMDTLLQVDLTGVGIFALERTTAAAGTDAISRLTTRMYCQGMRLVPAPKS